MVRKQQRKSIMLLEGNRMFVGLGVDSPLIIRIPREKERNYTLEEGEFPAGAPAGTSAGANLF